MRFAVLGTGRMGELRAGLLAATAGVDEVLLAGRDPDRTRGVAERCGARPATVAQALGAVSDGVVIASATADHAEQLRAAAETGAAVLCEKPMAMTVDETEASIAVLQAAGTRVQIGFQRRFDPALRAAYDLAAAGDLGTLYMLRISARDAQPSPEHYIPSSGGIFRDMHVHDFDLARWLSGREVALVYATGAVREHQRFARHGDVDTAAILLTMDDGMPVTIDGLRHDPRGQDVRVEAVGSRDAVVCGMGERTPLRSLEPGAAAPSAPGWESTWDRFAEAFVAETAAFVALVRDGGESACPPDAALQALRIAVACDRSRAEGVPVPLDGGGSPAPTG